MGGPCCCAGKIRLPPKGTKAAKMVGRAYPRAVHFHRKERGEQRIKTGFAASFTLFAFVDFPFLPPKAT
jgi:hypothetical protein